jgi:hypothetical protein
VDDIEAAREEFLSHGVDVSEVSHDAGGGFHAGTHGRARPGRDPQGRSYGSYAASTIPTATAGCCRELRLRGSGSRAGCDGGTSNG